MYEVFEKRMLNDIVKYKDGESLEKQIEDWSKNIFDLTANIGVTVPDDQKYHQQFLLAWLLQNIPTIGMFCNEDGNKRFNVLSDYIYPYVYTNQYHKRQIVERILKTAVEKNFNRFSTYAWQGRQFLSLENVPFSCFFTKRGYLYKASMHKVIIPIAGETLREIQRAIDQVEDLEFVKDMKLLANKLDFKNYFSELMLRQNDSLTEHESEICNKLKAESKITSRGLEIKEFFQDMMSSMMQQEEWDKQQMKEYFTKLRASDKEWNECYLNIIDAFISREMNLEKMKDLKKQEIFNFIAKGWTFMHKDIHNEILPYLQTNKLKEDYMQRCETDPALKATNQRIIKYILTHGRYPVRQKQLEQCFYAFIREIFEVAEKIENAKACEILINLR